MQALIDQVSNELRGAWRFRRYALAVAWGVCLFGWFVVYTIPEIAGVGLTEEDAKAAGHETKVGKFPMLANSRAKTNHEPDGFVKVVADAKTDRVLGVWCIASVAGTMIAQAAQAMEFGATSEDIAYTCHAHPTHSEAIKEAAMAVTGKPIHI